MRRLLLLTVTAVLLAGCGGPSTSAEPTAAAPTTAGPLPALPDRSTPATTKRAAVATTTPAPTLPGLPAPPPEPAGAATPGRSGELVAALGKQIPQARLTVAFTEDDDPDQILGQPGAYIGKAAFSDSRVRTADRTEDESDVANGGVVEVYRTAAQAKARKAYVNGIVNGQAGADFGREYLYVSGTALLRLSDGLSTAVVRNYESAWGRAVAEVL